MRAIAYVHIAGGRPDDDRMPGPGKDVSAAVMYMHYCFICKFCFSEYNNGGTAATTKSVQMVQYAGSTNAKFMTGNRDDVTGAMRSPAHLIQSRAALLLSDSVDNQSLRSAHNSSSPYASLPRLPNGTVSSTAQRSGGSGSPRLASNSTLRPRPPPYKPPNSAALPVVQRPTSGSSTSAGGGVGGSSTLLPIAVNVMPSLVTGGGSVIPQSSSSRVLYC